MADGERTLRVTVGPQAVGIVIVAIAAAIAIFAVLTAASRIIGWALACAVVAALIEPLVARVDRRLPRPLAILVVLVGLGIVAVVVAGGIFADLDNQYDRLQEDAPRAAAELESSERFGELAQDFRLEERVAEVLDRVERPTEEVPASAATTAQHLLPVRHPRRLLPLVGTTVRKGRGGADQRRRGACRGATSSVTSRSGALAATSSSRSRWPWLPGSSPSVSAGGPTSPRRWSYRSSSGALSVVPGFGILLGALPTLLLASGLEPGVTTTALAVAFVALQVAHELVQRRLVYRRSLVVGPAAIVITMIVGFEIYGIGGAFYGAALAVFAMAALDAAGDRDLAR